MECFTTQQVAQVTGVNRKTLHYWDRSGFLSPTLAQAHGTGTRRLFSFQDVVAVRVAQQLRSQGISLQALRRVVRFLQNQKGARCPLAERYLVTDGKDVFSTNGRSVESVLRQPGQGCLLFLVDLAQIVENLGDMVATLQKAAKLVSVPNGRSPGNEEKPGKAKTAKRKVAGR